MCVGYLRWLNTVPCEVVHATAHSHPGYSSGNTLKDFLLQFVFIYIKKNVRERVGGFFPYHSRPEIVIENSS